MEEGRGVWQGLEWEKGRGEVVGNQSPYSWHIKNNLSYIHIHFFYVRKEKREPILNSEAIHIYGSLMRFWAT